MPDPVISVVVPTRDRPDTLQSCLETLRLNISPDIEIVVQDNFSGPETEATVRQAQMLDSRIRFERSPTRTSQRHNFELGLRATRGTYLTIIGDDDGFVPGALDWLSDKLKSTPVDAVRWNLLKYVWPNLSGDGEGFLDVFPDKCSGDVSLVPVTELRRRALAALTEGSWDNLLVYHGMISRNVYERMRSTTDGVFFAYPMPDVYAHTLLPFFCDNYLHINHYMSVYGLSAHSAGSSWTGGIASDEAALVEGQRWIKESLADQELDTDGWFPSIRTQRFHEFKVLDFASKRGMLAGYKLDRAVWIKAIVAEVWRAPHQLQDYENSVPVSDVDKEVFNAVFAAGRSRNSVRSAPPDIRFSPDDRIPSLRLADFERPLSDNVTGAALAVVELTGRIESRLRNEAATSAAKQSIHSTFRIFVRKLQRFAPLFATHLANHHLMPVWLWRWLKMMQSGRPVSRKLVEDIEQLHRAYLQRR